MKPRAPSRLTALIDRFHQRQRATINLFRNSALEAQKSRLPQMAAALSYRTVFGLIPVLVVSLVAIRVFFVNNDDIAKLVSTILQHSGLSSINLDDQALMGPMPEEAAPAAAPAQTQNLDKWIKDLVEKVGGINFAAVGYISLAALLYAALSMLVEVERAFNQIYRVPAGRSWVRRLTQYWTMLTLGTLALAATFVVGQKFTVWVESAANWGEQRAMIVAAVGYLVTVTISCALLVMAYMVVPNTRVKFGAALAGAAFAALLWEAGKWGFTQYIRYSAGYARLYGSLALIPLFLLWIYVTWCIVLYGLNFAYYLQHGRFQTRAQPTEVLGQAIVDPAAALAVMASLARRFESGKPPSAARVAADIGVQEPIARQLLERLVVAGLVLPVRADAQREELFTLARPPERITAEEIVALGEEFAGGVKDDPVGTTMHDARLASVRGKTLAAFAGAPRTPPGPEEPHAQRAPRPAQPPVPART
ncbi:MAG: YhjD/YihY/BrkB family envelope integrity protein [Phycisphaerales bacterium]